MVDLLTKGDAVFSPCRTWRYSLTRAWDANLPRLCFIMLNPSTADADVDDATTRRVLRWAEDWGYGSYEAVNLFALLSVSPQKLKQVPDPVGPVNDRAILRAVTAANLVVAAWGTHGTLFDRDREVLRLLGVRPLYCLHVTQKGHPGHPLYLTKSVKPMLYKGAELEGTRGT